MLILYYTSLKNPVGLLIAYVLQVIPYFLLLKKLEIKPYFAFLPNVAEYKMGRKVFPKRRTFFRPFILAAILVACAYYINPSKSMGRIFVIIAFIVWSIYLIRLYRRLAKCFGHGIVFAMGCILLPPIFLTRMGLDKKTFTAPEFKPEKPRSKGVRVIRRILFVALSAAELLVIIAGCGIFTVRERMPVLLINALQKDIREATDTLDASGELVTREALLGSELPAVTEANRSRAAYAPDHSEDRSAIVYVYMIGSNLEAAQGLASFNLNQMINASRQGSGLTFIVEAGGSDRWIMKGMDNASYGRYEISNGKLTLLESLPADTNMSDAQTLTDFLTWSAANYSADRNLLVLWDHGGGLYCGYGIDDLNGETTMKIPDLAAAIHQSGMIFDIIGFDACLMQDIEVAYALAPYADYYIASEESEGGYGWAYTNAFSALAADPGMSSEDFGKQLIASYDPYNTITTSGDISKWTLSFVDLTLVEAAYDRLEDFWEAASEVIPDNPESFADISLAAAHTYSFSSGLQIDLIDFLTKLETLDYTHEIVDEAEMDALIKSLQACIICRNGASAEGINGLAFAFPYACIQYYDDTSTNLEMLSLTKEKHALDMIFSIMVAQQEKAADSASETKKEGDLLSMLYSLIPSTVYSEQAWYIEGFEDYDSTVQLINIPLTELDGEYQVELPEKTWDIIADVQTMVYQLTDDDGSGAARRFIGNDYLGDTDENGHTLIAPDDYWVHIGDQLVCYEADQVKVTEDGEIYTGRAKALLNGDTEVYILIEWNDTVEGQPETAKVLGYVEAIDLDAITERGYSELQSGSSIQFLFDYYDAEGNFIETRPDGKRIRVTSQERLEVTDQALEPCTIEFGGILTDIYQRIMTTEMLTVEINR